MTPEVKAQKIVDQMYQDDAFSQWLGIERVAEKPGYSVLRMKARPEMCNGFGIVHGGVTFSFADSALAFACNSQGQKAVSIETAISHTQPAYPGDILTATATEENLGNRIAIYKVEVHNQKNELIALFKGTVYRKKENWKI